MITLDNLGHFRRGRVWINNLPEIQYKVMNKITSSVELENSVSIKASSLALELLLSRRDISNYAFLGVKYIPNNENEARVTVYISEDEGDFLDDNIAMKSDHVLTGIPSEYAESVMNTAIKFIREEPQFISGDLEFYIGAHGVVGSSKSSFSKVTELIIKLLSTELNTISKPRLEEIIRENL